MNEDELMIKYSNQEILNEDELKFLEEKLLILMNEARLTHARPSIATDEICDWLGLRHESFKINCIASILDNIKPLENEMCREQQVFHVLLQAKFLYY